MKRYILFLIFFYFLSSSYCYFLQDLLNITTSAREKGLGGRFTSDIEVLSASKFNPSILGFIDKKKLVLDYNIIYRDLFKSYSLGIFYPLSSYGFSFSFINFDFGEFTNTETLSDSYILSEFKKQQISSLFYSIGFGYKISSKFSVGFGVKHFSSKFFDIDASFTGVDLAGLYYLMKNLTFGFIFEDIYTTKIAIEDISQTIPLCLGFGLNYKLDMVKHIDKIDIEIDFSKKRDILSYNFSVETKLKNIFVRLGYNNSYSYKTSSKFSLGFGFFISKRYIYQIDYAYTFYLNPDKYNLPESHYISLVFSFDRKK